MKITQPITIKKLKEIYDEYFDELFGFVYVRNGFRREDAEETIHDLFVRFWENRERFDPDKGSLRTWLYAILKIYYTIHIGKVGVLRNTLAWRISTYL